MVNTDHLFDRSHNQFDNNLPPHYQSKLARLNIECADSSLLQDCLPGQKWKCINEDGRWRKHKCKFHKEVQDHLAEINKYLSAQQSRRNCACFTANGLVYTKIKGDRDVFPPKQKRFDGHRHRNGRYKRDVSDDDDDEEIEEVYNEKMPPEFENLLQMDQVLDNIENSLELSSVVNEHSRKKREADYISQTIDELHSVLLTLEKKYLNNTKGPVQCFVEETGKVNCSTIVYENEDAWRQSRTQIDMLIKVLKDKIMNLKDIKRHLREHRPANMTSFYDDVTDDNLESSDEVDVDEISRRKQHSKHRHHQGMSERRKRPKNSSTTTTTTTEDDTIMLSSTTEIDESLSSSSSAPQITMETTPRQPQRTRNRTRISKTSTPSTTTTTTEADEIFSSSSSNYEEITSESLDDVVTSEFVSSSKDYDVTSELIIPEISTTLKPLRVHRPMLSENSINHAVNISNNASTMQAECYCASRFER